MSTAVLKKLNQAYQSFIISADKGKTVYLHPNDKKRCLEISSLKKNSLSEVFQKTQDYLQKDFQAGPTIFEMEKQIECLASLLKRGKKLIKHYDRKTHTLCRRLLKLIHAYAPHILKNYFPRLFNNQVKEAEQKTHATYQSCSRYIEQIKMKLAETSSELKADLNLRNIKHLKNAEIPLDVNNKQDIHPFVGPQPKLIKRSINIDSIPDVLIGKFLQESLITRDRVAALGVCRRWNEQLIKATARDKSTNTQFIKSIIASLNGKQFKPVIKELNAILDDKEINGTALTPLDRKKMIQERILTIFASHHDLLKDHIEIVKTAVTSNGWALVDASDDLKGNVEIVRIAIAQNGLALEYASDELKGNAEIVRIAIAQNSMALEWASTELQDDVEIVKIAVAQNGLVLKHASNNLKTNADIVKIAVAQHGDTLGWASNDLRNNAAIVKIAVAQYGKALAWASNGLKSNAEVVKIAVAQNGEALAWASNHLKNNVEIVKIAVAQNGDTLRWASTNLKGNIEVVKIAVTQYAGALAYASADLKNNLEIVKIAVAQIGNALDYASTNLKDNAEVVKIALTQNGNALAHASTNLKGNAEIVKIAVAQYGGALAWVSDDLKNNAEIVKIAVAQNGSAFGYASAELKNNAEIWKIADNSLRAKAKIN